MQSNKADSRSTIEELLPKRQDERVIKRIYQELLLFFFFTQVGSQKAKTQQKTELVILPSKSHRSGVN